MNIKIDIKERKTGRERERERERGEREEMRNTF